MSARFLLEGLRTYLRTNVNLTAKVGQKIYLNMAPQKPAIQEPYIVIKTVAGDRVPLTLCSPNSSSPLVDITVVTRGTDEGLEAEIISNILYDELQYFKGFMDGIEIQWIRMDHPPRIFEDPVQDGRMWAVNELTIDYVRV